MNTVLDYIYSVVAAVLVSLPLWIKLRRLERKTEKAIAKLDARYNQRDKQLVELVEAKLQCYHDAHLKVLETRLDDMEQRILDAIKKSNYANGSNSRPSELPSG